MTLWLLPLVPIIAGAFIATLGDRSRLLLGIMAVATLAATLVLALLGVSQDWTATLVWTDAIRLSAAFVPVSAAVAIMVPTVAIAVVFHATQNESKTGLARLIGLMILFTGGMELVVVANDLLTLLIGWELIGACSWALISHKWRQIDNPQSGLYAFVTTRAGDLGLFAALMALFTATGSFDYAGIQNLGGPLQWVVGFGILFSAASKAGQVPFSPWLFRAMAGPSSVSALLHAATLVAAGAYLVARLHPYLAEVPGFETTAIAIGLTTALAGGITGVLQDHAKRLLAASTSAQLGFMFVAVGAGYPGIAVLHMIVHATFKAPLFLSAGIAGEAAGTYQLDRLRLGRELPVVAIITLVAVAGLAGLVGSAGGWSKEEIVKASEHTGFWLALSVMAGGTLSAAYATRFQLLAYGRRDKDADSRVTTVPGWVALIGIAALSAMTLILSLLWFSPVAESAAAALDIILPKGSPLVFALSLLLVFIGIAIGVYLVRYRPALGATGSSAAASDWLGLPKLIDIVLIQPADAIARAAARADDRVVDRGIRGTAAFGDWLARLGDRFGEAATDGIPEGTARLTEMFSHDLRRLQTGLSHHYYAYIIGGVFIIFAILVVGA
ncbi:MAG: NADH-quinone oxidoreductase subunit 5 family protein [Sulfitobacter sp.]|uniref:NADH-quinone oxidoreductase subunit 5 family protein n=1 Tax=Sulfitobacter sp. TaxID=1903071 RepID=UPI00405883EB